MGGMCVDLVVQCTSVRDQIVRYGWNDSAAAVAAAVRLARCTPVNRKGGNDDAGSDYAT